MYISIVGCVSEAYSYPFPPEILFQGYIKGHEKFYGRQWLFSEINHDLFEINDERKDMVMVADMGYGKSAIISNILCGHGSEPITNIRKSILAYHICRFDVLSTKNPAVFIRRLIGMISMQLPAFGQIISNLPNTSIIYDKHICEQDPNGCFDQGILFPLKGLMDVSVKRAIIIVDALDECSGGQTEISKISELLRSRTHMLPSWISFLITSRNISQSVFPRHVSIKHLQFEDERNYNDIKEYVKETQQESFTMLMSLLKLDLTTDVIDNLVQRSRGNFLFLKHAIEYWKSIKNTTNIRDIPQSLETVYELNFERIFGIEQTSYENAKCLLEILCASRFQVTKSELYNIISAKEEKQMTTEAYEQTLNKLSFFLKLDENNVFVFTHTSIRFWLERTTSIYAISLRRGSLRLATYLFKELEINTDSRNITQLVLYVSESGEKKMLSTFHTLMHNRTTEIRQQYILHEVVEMSDSREAVDLIYKYYPSIDYRNEAGLTASCVATLAGHLQSLRRLIELGSNISTTVTVLNRYSLLVHHSRTENDIQFYKRAMLPGYNLLHIASQFGHKSVVDYLIQKQSSLMSSKTHLGNLPLHLACEFGHLDIVKQIIESSKAIPDIHCLFLSSKHQHQKVVKYILSHDTEHSCISENEAKGALSAITLQTQNVGAEVASEFFLPLDIWWKIKKETPLHVSVTTGNIEIFRIIAHAQPKLLNCYDSGGLTPFLSSVVQQKIEIYKEMVALRERDICNGPSGTLKTLKSLYVNYTQIWCISNMTLTHFLASYGNIDMIVYAIKNQIYLEYYRFDANGTSAMHYAACADNMAFLIVALKLKLNFSVSSSNGSTPYHSAALCGSELAYYLWTEYEGNRLPTTVTDRFRTLAHYTVMSTLTSDQSYLEKEREEKSVYILFQFSKENKNLLLETDSQGRNIFHFALERGHFDSIEFLLKKLDIDGYEMLFIEDRHKKTPLDYLFARLSKTSNKHVYHLPRQCVSSGIYNTDNCLLVSGDDLGWVFSPVERGIYEIVISIDRSNLQRLFSHHFKQLLMHTKIYLVPLLLSRMESVKRSLIDFFNACSSFDTEPDPYSMLYIMTHYPEALASCNQNGSGSPMHQLTKHMDTILNVLDEEVAKHMINTLFRSSNVRNILCYCKDKDGFTVFDRSVIDKSYKFVQQLIEYKCVREYVFSNITWVKFVDDIIYSTKLTKSVPVKLHKEHKCYQVVSSGQTTLYHEGDVAIYKSRHQTIFKTIKGMGFMQKDQLISTALNIWKHKLRLREFCKNGTKGFSWIHLIAASDMWLTMETVLRKVPALVNCTNEQGVTPYYLAKVFNAVNVLQVINDAAGNKPAKALPSEEFERVLFFKLISNFSDMDVTSMIYFLKSHEPAKDFTNEHEVTLLTNWLLKQLKKGVCAEHFTKFAEPALRLSFRIYRVAILITTYLSSCGDYCPYISKYNKLIRYFDRLLWNVFKQGVMTQRIYENDGIFLQNIWNYIDYALGLLSPFPKPQDSFKSAKDTKHLLMNFVKRLVESITVEVRSAMLKCKHTDAYLAHLAVFSKNIYRLNTYYDHSNLSALDKTYSKASQSKFLYAFKYINILRGLHMHMMTNL